MIRKKQYKRTYKYIKKQIKKKERKSILTKKERLLLKNTGLERKKKDVINI